MDSRSNEKGEDMDDNIKGSNDSTSNIKQVQADLDIVKQSLEEIKAQLASLIGNKNEPMK